MKKFILIISFVISYLINLSQTSIGQENIIISGGSIQNLRSYCRADINNDGKTDIITGSLEESKIAWYKNEGNGEFSDLITIYEYDYYGRILVFPADLDGDNDIDIIAANSQGYDQLIWFENLDGEGSFSDKKVIRDRLRVLDLHATDMDNDGDIDILISPYEKVVWLENTNGKGKFETEHIITDQVSEAMEINHADIDNDGDQDVFVYSFWDYGLYWYENIDGLGNFSDKYRLQGSSDIIKPIQFADFDGDLDLDLVFVQQGIRCEIVYLENVDGEGTLEFSKYIDDKMRGTSYAFPADLDNDGDVDIISSSNEEESLFWYENTDGGGIFSEKQILYPHKFGIDEVFTEDIDNDGDLDIISASFELDQITWFENTDGNVSYNEFHNVSNFIFEPDHVIAADIDNDGDKDIVTSSYFDAKVAWQENIDGFGTFSDQKIIADYFFMINGLLAADLDGDKDLDIVTQEIYFDKLVWFENIDGLGNFSGENIIYDDWITSVFTMKATDIDNDDDLDIFMTTNNGLKWFKNLDGLGNFGEPVSIEPYNNSYDIHNNSFELVDIDEDGDQDIISAETSAVIASANNFSIFKNIEGSGNFEQKQTFFTADNPKSVHTAYIDNDHNIDILITYYDNHKFYVGWFKNDGTGNLEPIRIIPSVDSEEYIIKLLDFDNDGDVDILSNGIYGVINWHENLDGNGNFSDKKSIIEDFESLSCISASDLNNDKRFDIIAGSKFTDKISWFKNLPFEIVEQPQNKLISCGEHMNLSIATNGSAHYQWQSDIGNGFTDLEDNYPFSGVESNTLTIQNTPFHFDGYFYRCKVHNEFGFIYSSSSLLSVEDNENPSIACRSSQVFNLPEDTNSYVVKGNELDPVSANDNCEYTISNNRNSLSTLDGEILPVGVTNITWTIEDIAGNISTCNFDVTITSHVGINHNQFSDIIIKPNPTKNIFFIESQNKHIQFIRITDITGRTVIERKHIDPKEEFDLSNLGKGIYIVKIHTDNGVLTSKIVKK